jgi:hypothetical protein
MKKLLVLLLPCLTLAAACSPSASTFEQQVRIAVEATLNAVPASTLAPLPPLPSLPATPTPVTLSGLFCEYQFCIGHPPEMTFYDLTAVQSALASGGQPILSTYSQGNLAAFSNSLFIQIDWQDAPGINDPQFMLDLITQSAGDARNGSVEPKVLGDLNIYYLTITPTPGSALTFGGAAAWICGGRAFAWKVYAAQPELVQSHFTEALARFRCEPH